MPGDYVQWPQDDTEKYVTAFSTPNSPPIINLLNPLTKYSAWGTFGAGGYDMHKGSFTVPETHVIAADGYWHDVVYFEEGEQISVKLNSVTGGLDADISFYAIADGDWAQFAADPCAGGVPVWTNGSGSKTGAVLKVGPLPAGWYHLVFHNSCNNFSDRTATFSRTGTRFDVVYDTLQSIFYYLRSKGLIYTSISNDFFSGWGKLRWPSQSLSSVSANCADGSVLFASILERLDLEPVLIHVTDPSLPHMYVGVRSSKGSNVLWPIETTMVGGSSSAYEALSHAVSNEFSYYQTNLYLDVFTERQKGVTPIPK